MARPVHVLASLVVLVSLFAGCLGNMVGDLGAPPPGWDPRDTQRTDLARRLEARYGETENATASDWFLATMPVASDGNVTAFRWTIPPGVLLPPMPEDPVPRVQLEVVPLYGGQAGSDWSIFVFLDNGTKADLASARYRTGPSAVFLRLQAPQVAEGLGVTIVVAHKSLVGTAESGIAFRTVDWRPANTEQPSPDLGGRMGTVRPFALDVVGRSEGFEFDYYLRVRAGIVVGEERQGAVTAEKRRSQPTPLGEVREYDYSKAVTVSDGWGVAVGFYLAPEAMGRWEVEADVFGAKLAASLPFAYSLKEPMVVDVVAMTFGEPLFLVFGSGTGGARSTFTTLEIRNGTSEVVLLEHFEARGDLRTLIGREVPQIVFAGGGRVESLPRAD